MTHLHPSFLFTPLLIQESDRPTGDRTRHPCPRRPTVPLGPRCKEHLITDAEEATHQDSRQEGAKVVDRMSGKQEGPRGCTAV